MEFRTPDNPISTTLAAAISIEQRRPGEYCFEPKGDGWRSPLYLPYGGTWTRHSKYSRGEQAKSTPPDDLMKELAGLEIPEGTAFDAEWMGPRCVKDTRGQHWFCIYDLLYLDGQWQGDLPYRERKSAMTTILNLYKAKAERAGKPHSRIMITDFAEGGLLQMYNDQKPENAGNELSEGVVMKRWDSKLVGGGDNKSWLKIRYRG
jgi:hypothetical protein